METPSKRFYLKPESFMTLSPITLVKPSAGLGTIFIPTVSDVLIIRNYN